MVEINFGLFIGFGLVLVTLFAVSWLGKRLIKKHVPDPKPVLAIYGPVVNSVFAFGIVAFVLAFIWTGWHPAPSPQSQGELDLDAAGELEYVPGENRAQERRKRLEQGDDLQREGQEGLQEFRTKLLQQRKEEEKR